MPNHITSTIRFSDTKKFRELAVSKDKDGNDIVDFNKLIPMPTDLTNGTFAWRTGNMFGFRHEQEELEFNQNVFAPYLRKFYTDTITQQDFINKVREDMLKEERQFLLNAFKKSYRMSDKETINDEPKDDVFVGVINPTFIRVVGGYFNHRRYNDVDWYQWHVHNWGTKWNAYDCLVEDDKAVFDTAWATPINWLEKLADYLDFTVTWADEDLGCNFGIGVARNGVLTLKYLDEDDDFSYEDKVYLATVIKGYDYEDYFNEDRRIITEDRQEVLNNLVSSYL